MKKQGSKIFITGEFITLGQLLKFLRLVSTGGEEKIFVLEHNIYVNNIEENRRGRKLRDGDKISIDGDIFEICISRNLS